MTCPINLFGCGGHNSSSVSSAGIALKNPSLSRSTTSLNSEFSFSRTSCHTMVKESILSNYLPVASGRIVGLILFPRVLTYINIQTNKITSSFFFIITYACSESFMKKFLLQNKAIYSPIYNL